MNRWILHNYYTVDFKTNRFKEAHLDRVSQYTKTHQNLNKIDIT